MVLNSPDLRIQFDPEEVGSAMAHTSDDVQAATLNAFMAELYHACGKNRYRTQMQTVSIQAKLSTLAKDILELDVDCLRKH